MQDNEKLYKVYHRNYNTIEELYEDLSDAVLNIGLENNRIIIRYNSDVLKIEESKYCYRTYLNNEPEKEEWEDQDIYFYALDFVHEQRKDLTVFERQDTCITDINKKGITYVDELGRNHVIFFSDCAANGPSKSCVAKRNITKWCFEFYSSGIPIRILFKKSFVFKKGKRFLVGGKAKRFRELQQAISDSGYTTYDFS